MRTIRGVPASSGVSSGAWVRAERRSTPAGGPIAPGDEAREVGRLRAASDAAASELDDLADSIRAGGRASEADIFAAQAAIARDPALAAMASERIETSHYDAIAAIAGATDAFADQLRALGDELLAARAADVLDVADRITRHLAGIDTTVGPTFDRPAIVVADDLPPSVTATLPREDLLGIALEGSSPTAHAAILARAYGIPAVVGARGLLEALAEAGHDAVLAIDGDTGEIVVDPDVATIAGFNERSAVAERRHAADLEEAELPATTQDGTSVVLLANIGTPQESGRALELGARGVGLFRTEFLFLERTKAPSEDEQVEAYRTAVEAFAPFPVTIRLLDVGGDKPIPYVPIADEANPFLGVRALRLAHAEPSLFVTQLRACLRAATSGVVKVMAPMVADAADAHLLLALTENARAGLRDDGVAAGDVTLGVMLEIPSAILVADSYFRELGFASIGTNDLLQYALAVDRGNPALERYRDSLHPALLRLVRDAVAASARAHIDLSVCGEMAGDPPAALALVGLGIRSLSMAASSLAAVRRAIRVTALRDLERAAGAALDDRDAATVRARFEEFVRAPVRA